MRDMRDDTRQTWRTDDEFERDQGYMDEPSGQWGQEGTRYGQPGYGYGQGSSSYQGGYGYGQGYQGSQGRGYYGRRQGYQGSYGQGQFGQGSYGQGQFGQEGRGYGSGVYEPGSQRHWGKSGSRGMRRGEFGETGYGYESDQGFQGRSWADQQGPFAGRGPKGYRRSDDRIREDVSDRLTDHQWLDASDIDVRVEAGMVTLSGNVKSRDDKRLAEDVAMSISGVKDVINQIHVDQGILDQFAEAVTGEKQTTRSGEKVTTR